MTAEPYRAEPNLIPTAYARQKRPALYDEHPPALVTLADELDGLADDLVHEGAIADRPGQMDRLNAIAGRLRVVAIHLGGKT